MKIFLSVVLGLSLITNVFSQKVTTSVIKNYGTLDYKEDVRVFTLNDSIPTSSEIIGTIVVEGSSLSKTCNWESVIETAKLEARKIGGNSLKITDHQIPNMARSCHSINANILFIKNIDSIPVLASKDTSLANSGYALIHVYRFSGVGPIVSYDLYLGDSIICRVANKWKKTIKVRKEGLNTIWAKTEVKKEIPVDIKPGEEYYVRCSVSMGAFVGHPKLELVDKNTGKIEYGSVKNSKSAIRDIITLNNDKEIECVITGEDDINWYIDVFRNGKKVKTLVQKAQVKNVERGE